MPARSRERKPALSARGSQLAAATILGVALALLLLAMIYLGIHEWHHWVHGGDMHYRPRHQQPGHAPRQATVRGMFLLGVIGLATTGAVIAQSGPGDLSTPAPSPGATLVLNLAKNPDCKLRVPDNPLSAKGLATPYVLSSAGATCSETDPGTAAFVQATILDPATGNLSVYAPVVRDAGQPVLGAMPPKPDLPRHAVITIWTGFNGDTLKLTGPGHGDFVNFPQQSYANSPRFFRELRKSIAAGMTVVPGLGMASDGKDCPSSRDFSITDQDPSDNNPQAYPAYGVKNASDEKLLDAVDAALGCVPWTAPSLDPAITGNTFSPSGPLQEQQAATFQGDPVALVPGNDPFVTRNGNPSLFLQNLYRHQVGQPPATSNGTTAYCNHLADTGEPRLKADQSIEASFPATSPTGSNLANQLAARFVATWSILGCTALTGMDSPITVDNPDFATSATYK